MKTPAADLEHLVGKTIAAVEFDRYESNYGPETAIVFTFTDGTGHSIVLTSADD